MVKGTLVDQQKNNSDQFSRNDDALEGDPPIRFVYPFRSDQQQHNEGSACHQDRPLSDALYDDALSEK